MPIQKIPMPNGQTYYRYGDTGKLYPTQEQALQQMRAMIRSGYKPQPTKGNK